MNETRKRRKARRIRRRTDNQGDPFRQRKVTIRVTRELSNELASLQGLMWAFGKKETLADLFEDVLMPRLRDYVKPYVAKVRRMRAQGKLTIEMFCENGRRAPSVRVKRETGKPMRSRTQ